MVTADEFAKGFGQQSHNDKNENFEISTLAEVLKQLGWTAGKINALKSELDASFGWSWFNSENLIGNFRVGSLRIFNYNFQELFKKPANHPITLAFKEFKGDSEDPCCLVFKVFDDGKWLATNLELSEYSHHHIVTDGGKFKFNVIPFPKFFQLRWGDNDNE